MATLKDFIAAPATPGARSIMPGDQQLPQQPTLKDLLTYKDPKTWQKVLGIIGDGLQIAGGGRASYMPTLQAQRQHDADIQQEWNLAEMKGQQDIERFRAQKQYERDNPAPTDLEIYMKRAGIDPNSEQGQSMFRSKAENTANPPVWRQGPDMQFYRVDTPQTGRPQIGATVPMPQRGGGGQSGDPDQAARVRAQLIERFGAPRGESEYQKWLQAFGGGSGNAAGSFP